MKHPLRLLLALLTAAITCQARANTGEFGYFLLGLMVPAAVAGAVGLAYLVFSKTPWLLKILALLVAIAAEILFFILAISGAIPFDWHTLPLIAIFPIAGLFIADQWLRRR